MSAKTYMCRRCRYPQDDDGLDNSGICDTCNDYLKTQGKASKARIMKFVAEREATDPSLYPVEHFPNGKIRGIPQPGPFSHQLNIKGGTNMSAKKSGGLGFDPLAGKAARGVDAIIRSTTQDAQEAQEQQKEPGASSLPKTQGRKGQKLQRITMGFSDENIEYLRIISGFEAVSATEYVNRLIDADREKRAELVEKIEALKKETL